jgi:hypothetical protein
MDDQVVGKVGIVTCSILPGRTGEVMIKIRGGSEAFDAIGPPDTEICTNTRVMVDEYFPPRKVRVSSLERAEPAYYYRPEITPYGWV